MKSFDLSEIQATHILDMPLRRLTALETDKLREEMAELEKRLKELHSEDDLSSDLTDGEISKRIEKIFDMRPGAIERRLKLRNPIYSETAAYGHMGRTPRTIVKHFSSPYSGERTVEVELFTWENLDYVERLKNEFDL